MKLTARERQARNEIIGRLVDRPVDDMTVSPSGLVIVPIPEVDPQVQAAADEAMKRLEHEPPGVDDAGASIRHLLNGLRTRNVL